jgi:DNA topoisomerase I
MFRFAVASILRKPALPAARQVLRGHCVPESDGKVDLIILESPNKVRDVERYARALGLDAKAVATVGHLLDLPPMAEGPAVDTSTFALSGFQPRDAGARERVARIRAAIAQADRVIVATDPDREGEAIGSEIWTWIAPGKAWRATFEEITAAGVERGLGEMRRSLATGAVEAALTRRAIDRLAGWHGTALVFDKLRQHRGLSAGRLQSAALRLVVERHREHESFRATTTHGVRVKLRTAAGAELLARVVDEQGDARSFPTEAEARSLVLPSHVQVVSVDAERKQQRPRPPFEASSWLQVACKALGISVKEATQATQALFENGHTTYPRTDTVRVADEAIEWARQEIERRFGRAYVPDRAWEHKDSAAGMVQGAHEAIRPTIPHDGPDGLASRATGEWGEAYTLVENRFLASQAAARVIEQTTLRLHGGDLHLLVRGQVELFDGWRRVLSIEAEEEPERPIGSQDDDGDVGARLPVVAAGDQLTVLHIEVITQVTKPKPLFTQASLVAELKRLGIGRPSTYQSVVPLILSRGWATEAAPRGRGKKGAGKARTLPSLVPTDAGRDLCDFLVEALPGLVDYDFTASMERALDEIEQGSKGRVEVARLWWSRFAQELAAAKTLKPRAIERKDLGSCPRCAAEGRSGRLRLIQGVNAETKKPYEFAGCDADTKEKRVCGNKAQVRDGQVIISPPCPHCQAPLRAVNRKNGGHSWLCEQHGWFLAGRRWDLVVAPACPRCAALMIHRERRDPKGEFFWACFADRVFLGSDRFGSVQKRSKERSAT